MRLLVLGAAGMLGHKLLASSAEAGEAFGTVRGDSVPAPLAAVVDPAQVITGVSAEDPGTVARAIEETDADAVVNCIGIVKQAEAASAPIPAIRVNSLFPHQVAQLCSERGKRFVHISTDCVFSGARGGYTEEDVPDPTDLYGRSKLLGEVGEAGGLTIRTSIVGRELSSSYGLIEWFLGEAGGSVRGFTRAVFSGLTTLALSQLILELLQEHGELAGLWHVSADPIDKYALLELAREVFGVEVEIEPDEGVAIDRSLDSSRFRSRTGWEPAGWREMIDAMAADPTPYEEIRRESHARR